MRMLLLLEVMWNYRESLALWWLRWHIATVVSVVLTIRALVDWLA